MAVHVSCVGLVDMELQVPAVDDRLARAGVDLTHVRWSGAAEQDTTMSDDDQTSDPILSAIRTLHGELSYERDREIAFAELLATRLDEIEPAAGDPRHQILAVTEGRIDGLRIALDLIAKRLSQLNRSRRSS